MPSYDIIPLASDLLDYTIQRVKQKEAEYKPVKAYIMVGDQLVEKLLYDKVKDDGKPHFPKSQTFHLCAELQDCAVRILKGCEAANGRYFETEYEERLKDLDGVLIECQTMEQLINLSYGRKYITGDQCHYWAELVRPVRQKAFNWRKSDGNRAAALREAKAAQELAKMGQMALQIAEALRPQYAVFLNSYGNVGNSVCSSSRGSRPAFTLPSNLYVSDDGTVFQNTAPSTPASISVPSSINGGSSITVSWGTSTDAEGNLEGYIVERQVDGGSWTQIYQGTATSTTNTVAFGTNTVAYRVKAYDAAGLESGWKTSSTVTVTNNRAPGAPGSLTVPAVVRGGSNLAISWTAASDSDGNLSGYELERQVDGGSWTQIYKGSALAYTDTITAGWNTVAYRVRSYDSYNATSTYVTSETRTVDNNAIPVITSSTTSGTDLGTKEDGFDLTYTVTDADNDTVTVKEYLDDVLKRTYTVTLGQSNTVQCVTAANWQKVLNGAHTIKVVANDGKADSTPYTVTFTKAVYEASITMAEPIDADDTITVMVLNILGSIPGDADLEVLVTNNALDDEPVWEDATADIKNGNNHIFTNKTATNGFAFNFKLTVSRGSSNTGGYITNIGGAFQ